MKRLIAIVIFLGIAAYVFVQIKKDRRFNKLSAYDHPISEQIDTEFYDQAVLKDYYKTVLEIGSFARSVWRTKMIDVRQAKLGDREESLEVDYYNELLATALMLQNKLETSKRYKDQGYSDTDVKMIMEHGLTQEDLRFKEKYYLVGLKIGSNGSSVWELQKILNTKGDSIPEDGIFNLITINRLKEYQSANNLFPSGEVDENTLRALLK